MTNNAIFTENFPKPKHHRTSNINKTDMFFPVTFVCLYNLQDCRSCCQSFTRPEQFLLDTVLGLVAYFVWHDTNRGCNSVWLINSTLLVFFICIRSPV